MASARWVWTGLFSLCLMIWAGAETLLADTKPKRLTEPSLSDRDRAHWAFQSPKPPVLPTVQQSDWIRTPIDTFILSRLEHEGLHPSPPADRATLLRRVTYDLTGLPPTPEDLAAFLADHRPEAYAAVVDRLLDSPHYGERWAQHWLDVVRYAESNGYEIDAERTHAWRYRDYVIRAFNTDKPYDRFLTEQLAGDELARGKDARACAELLIATGFNRCGPIHLVSGNTDPEVNRQEVLMEMTNGVGSALLGLTFGCARCHDHKFDPVSQADYYRLQSFFAAAQPSEKDLTLPEERAGYEQRMKEIHARLAPLQKKIDALEAPYRKRLREAKIAALEPEFREALLCPPKKRTAEQRKRAEQAEILVKLTWDEVLDALTPADREQRNHWRAEMHAIESEKPFPLAQAWAIANEPTVPATYILTRGDVKRKGAQVQPAFPRVLVPPAATTGVTSGSRDRLALARWLTAPDHPLTARVMVNRIWQHHFGRGLVGTPNDFGVRGEKPSHPELLDWLAVEFVRSGWSIKHMHRLMVLSNTYQQSSRNPAPQASAQRIDPQNRLLGRMNRQRLEGEALRDAVLATAGTLNPKLGGPMVLVPLEPEVYDLIFTEGEPDGLWPITPDPREHTRRSIYLFAKRNLRLPMLEAFDRPDTLNSCPVRPVSTFAPQALILMNGPFMQAQSRAFASRLLEECGDDRARIIDRAYLLALSRLPHEKERTSATQFLARQSESIQDRLRARLPVALPPRLPSGIDPALAAAIGDFCLALLNRNEFVYVN